jgi:hypothetical protein
MLVAQSRKVVPSEPINNREITQTKQFTNPRKQNSKENENQQNKTLKKRHEPLELLYCSKTK